MVDFDEDDLDPCVICVDTKAFTVNPSGFDGLHQKCPRCGEFKISGSALTILNHELSNAERAKLSGWSLEQNRAGAIPMITSHVIDNVKHRPLPTVVERATNLLKEAAYGQTQLGERFNINHPRFLAATYSKNTSEVSYLMKLLADQGLAEFKAAGGESEILPHGYIQLDELTKNISDSKQGFVAMWFDKSMDDAYEKGLQKGIMDAGFDPLRIDHHEHVNRIDDEIIAQIKSSKFVVADFTEHRGGVYFEAGFALGLDMPVIWTCRKDHMSELHFDIRQFNCID